ncbi:hypothetical protein GFPCMMHI_05009 [Ensifer adhaerens]|nr:hypothetical protein [Ensifer adhaerens]
MRTQRFTILALRRDRCTGEGNRTIAGARLVGVGIVGTPGDIERAGGDGVGPDMRVLVAACQRAFRDRACIAGCGDRLVVRDNDGEGVRGAIAVRIGCCVTESQLDGVRALGVVERLHEGEVVVAVVGVRHRRVEDDVGCGGRRRSGLTGVTNQSAVGQQRRMDGKTMRTQRFTILALRRDRCTGEGNRAIAEA